MYTVLCDGSLLHDTTSDDSRVFGAVLDLELNTPNFLSFTIYPSHPLYGLIRKFKSVIEVYQDGVLLFRGRVLNDTVTFDKSKSIICEGDRAFLNDSILRPYAFNGSIEDYLQMMIDSHNTQVETDKQFILGNVTVIDPNDYIIRSNSNYVKTWEEIKNKLIDNLGGYILVRRDDGINYIDYLLDSPYMSTQQIELGENLLDVIKETRADDIVTALIPLGAKLKDEEGNETDERLTIESVNGGVDFIHDADAVAKYGYIFDTITYDNVTVASNLLTKAQQDLAIRINLGVNVELKAIDLSMVKEPELWGRNLVRTSNTFNKGSSNTGITPSVNSDGSLKVIATIGNGNWHTSWYKSLLGIEQMFLDGEQFTVSIWIKAEPGSTGKPTIYLKNGMGYYNLSGTVGTEYSMLSYSGTWKKEKILSPHLGWRGAVGTFTIKAWKIEKGSIAHKWTPAPEDLPKTDEIRLFEYVKVTSQPHDIDTMALITKLSIDLLNPQNNTFTFGFNYQTFTDKQIQSDKAIKEIQSDYVTNEKVTSDVIKLYSAISQSAEKIMLEVSRLGGYNIITNPIGRFGTLDWTFETDHIKAYAVAPFNKAYANPPYLKAQGEKLELMYSVITDSDAKYGFHVFKNGKALSKFAMAEGGSDYSLHTKVKGNGVLRFKLREFTSLTPTHKGAFFKETLLNETHSTVDYATYEKTITLDETTQSVVLVVESDVSSRDGQYALFTNTSFNIGQPKTYVESITDVTSQLIVLSNEISTKVSSGGVVSAINQSAESIKINASKINLTGYVTVSSLSGEGTTTIDGSNIKTGTISADRINFNGAVGTNVTLSGNITATKFASPTSTNYYGEIGITGSTQPGLALYDLRYGTNPFFEALSLPSGFALRNRSGDTSIMSLGDTTSFHFYNKTQESLLWGDSTGGYLSSPNGSVYLKIDNSGIKIYKNGSQVASW